MKQDSQKPKARVKLVDRSQVLLRTVNVDRLIPEDHPARSIWEVLSDLDLEGFRTGIMAVEGRAGQSPFDPKVLLSLWIYALKDGVTSAREIAKRCGYDPAYQWLTGMKPINYHTISDFRTEHGAALNELFVQLLGVLTHQGLITLERVAHDGTKIRANAAGDSFRREKTLSDHLESAQDYIDELETQGDEIDLRKARARERAAKQRKERIERAIEEIEKMAPDKTEPRASITDPDARIMKIGGEGFGAGYNVQISTDAQASIIVGVGVTQSAADSDELIASIDRIKQNFEQLPDQMLVDGGFANKQNIVDAAGLGIDLYGPSPNKPVDMSKIPNAKQIAPEFYREHFTYDCERNAYFCPAGTELRFESQYRDGATTKLRYQARFSDCQNCANYGRCCTGKKKGRSIIDSVDHPAVAEFIDKMQTKEAKAIYRQRSQVAEFPNAWIKAKFGLRQFRLRGLVKVGVESLWACFAYNMLQYVRWLRKPSMVGVAAC